MAEATPNPAENDDNPWKKLNVSVQDADTLRQEAVEAHHDHLITEIETSEGPLATTLRYLGRETNIHNSAPVPDLDLDLKNDYRVDSRLFFSYGPGGGTKGFRNTHRLVQWL